MARFPAVQQMAPYLRDGALVVLDDTNRPQEKEIVRRWTSSNLAPRPLHMVKTVGRSTVLELSLRRGSSSTPVRTASRSEPRPYGAVLTGTTIIGTVPHGAERPNTADLP